MSDKIWWEKTVEYRFLQMLFTEDIFVRGLSISPLDGKHEKESGDAVLTQNDKWLLIEFKRDETCLSSEIQKYNQKEKGYNEAKEKLKKDGTHHFFIYGDSTSSTVLNLKSQLYWDYDPKIKTQAMILTQTPTQIRDIARVMTKTNRWAWNYIQNLRQNNKDNKDNKDNLHAWIKAQDLTRALTTDLAMAKAKADDLAMAMAKNNNSENNISITNIFEEGKNREEFVNYLNQLKKFRKDDKADDGSTVAMSIKDNKLIMIPIVNNKLVLSLENNMSNNNVTQCSKDKPIDKSQKKMKNPK